MSQVLPKLGNLQTVPTVHWEGTAVARGKKCCWEMLAEAGSTCSPAASLERPLWAQPHGEWLPHGAWLPQHQLHKALGAHRFITEWSSPLSIQPLYTPITSLPKQKPTTQKQKNFVFLLTKLRTGNILHAHEDFLTFSPNIASWEGVTRHLWATPRVSQIQS